MKKAGRPKLKHPKKQLGTRLKPETIKDIRLFSKHEGLGMAEFIELAVECYKQKLLRGMGK